MVIAHLYGDGFVRVAPGPDPTVYPYQGIEVDLDKRDLVSEAAGFYCRAGGSCLYGGHKAEPWFIATSEHEGRLYGIKRTRPTKDDSPPGAESLWVPASAWQRCECLTERTLEGESSAKSGPC